MSSKVSPTIADDIKKNSFLAVLGSLIVVFLYILLRFRKWQYSLGAVAAVFHDVMIVLSIFSIAYTFMPFNMEINQAFIAAVLTVIGYSLNDTIVIFDRIRENTKGSNNVPLGLVVNQSISTLRGKWRLLKSGRIFKAKEFIQYLKPVGFGPSGKTWPK